MTEPSTERLIDLETRIAFQEQALHEFNEIVTRQRRDIDGLTRKIAALNSQLEQLRDAMPEGRTEQPPPHY